MKSTEQLVSKTAYKWGGPTPKSISPSLQCIVKYNIVFLLWCVRYVKPIVVAQLVQLFMYHHSNQSAPSL